MPKHTRLPQGPNGGQNCGTNMKHETNSPYFESKSHLLLLVCNAHLFQLSQYTDCTCAVRYTVSIHLILHPSIQICSSFRRVARCSMFTVSAAWVPRKRKKPDLYPHQMNTKLHSWMQIGKEHAPETSSSSFLLHWLGSDAQSLPLTSEPKKKSRC